MVLLSCLVQHGLLGGGHIDIVEALDEPPRHHGLGTHRRCASVEEGSRRRTFIGGWNTALVAIERKLQNKLRSKEGKRRQGRMDG